MVLLPRFAARHTRICVHSQHGNENEYIHKEGGDLKVPNDIIITSYTVISC